MTNDKHLLDFLAEVGTLKRIKRSGWWMIGVPSRESVADHSFRCAAIGYILAKQEKADAGKVMLMSLFNDLHEARITDLHKVAHKYLNVREGEREAYSDQINKLPGAIKEELKIIRKEHDSQKTLESLVARDADLLECLFAAKEYVDLGFKSAQRFFKNAPKHLKTKSARRLWKSMKRWNSYDWWRGLEEFKR